MTHQYTIFGSPISLFTRKLEAAMQFYGASYLMERKPDDLSRELEQRAGTHQIPLLQTPENWIISDTTAIMSLLDSRFPARRLFPDDALGVLVHIVEEILDEWMARTMVHYRWHYDENTIAVASGFVGRKMPIKEARQLPLAQWGLRACRATGTESTTQQQAAEREYLGILTALSAQLEITGFAMGDRPSAVDTILIGSLRGHTNNDPLPDISGFGNVLAWDAALNNYAPAAGDWAPFEASTQFAEHIIELARDQYRPFIIGNSIALAAGDKAFLVETYGEQVIYLCRVYPERSRQMIVRRIEQQLIPTEQTRVVNWLHKVGLAECFVP